MSRLSRCVNPACSRAPGRASSPVPPWAGRTRKLASSGSDSRLPGKKVELGLLHHGQPALCPGLIPSPVTVTTGWMLSAPGSWSRPRKTAFHQITNSKVLSAQNVILIPYFVNLWHIQKINKYIREVLDLFAISKLLLSKSLTFHKNLAILQLLI